MGSNREAKPRDEAPTLAEGATSFEASSGRLKVKWEESFRAETFCIQSKSNHHHFFNINFL
jgi:hypothetical protein